MADKFLSLASKRPLLVAAAATVVGAFLFILSGDTRNRLLDLHIRSGIYRWALGQDGNWGLDLDPDGCVELSSDDTVDESFGGGGDGGRKASLGRGRRGSVDESLGGLLSLAFDESSCRSRFESAKLLKPPNHTPSPYLLEKLRSYEALHQKCGPNTELYRESIRQLNSNRSGGGPMECNYVVWIPQDGLGNRMIA
ncbi:hypothetical protein ZIOFF_029071 [Zingiber officinale]|uniref:Fucosyltransferase n=1 Tax=Zingiber officinale TaxID=94328 RepID=A0A8J5GM56_ZINOF|nr:hypothetical protein ZIOFF_029071 [Zingiber officinale]